jgi:hypothetical protein
VFYITLLDFNGNFCGCVLYVNIVSFPPEPIDKAMDKFCDKIVQMFKEENGQKLQKEIGEKFQAKIEQQAQEVKLRIFLKEISIIITYFFLPINLRLTKLWMRPMAIRL